LLAALLLSVASAGCLGDDGGPASTGPSIQVSPTTTETTSAPPSTTTNAPPPPTPSLSKLLGDPCRDRLHELDSAYARARRVLVESRTDLRVARASLRRANVDVRDSKARFEAANGELDAFVEAHPSGSLPSDDYAVYTDLRAAATARLAAANAAVAVYNDAVARHNAASKRGNEAARSAERSDRTYAISVNRCLRVVQAWDASARRLERRLSLAARSIAANGSVRCSSPAEWESEVKRDNRDSTGYEEQGYVVEGTTTMVLAPHVCFALDLLVRRDAPQVRLRCMQRELRDGLAACPPSLADVALAIVTLAHEAEHAAGITGEARAECYARQAARGVARDLALPAAQATRVGRYAAQRIRQPPEYRSKQCRDGGELDLDRSSTRFP
jgi:hypothetical protein